MYCRNFRYCALPGAAFAIVLTTAFDAATQTIPTVEAFAGHARYGQASLSPDGTRLALVTPQDGGDTVVAISLANPVERKAYQFNRSVITGVVWYDNETVITQNLGRFSTVPEPALRSYLAYPLTDDEPNFINYVPFVGKSGVGASFVWSLYEVTDLVPQEEGYFLMSAYVNRQQGMQRLGSSLPTIWGYDLLRTVVANGQAGEFKQGTEYTGQWITDGSGNIVARIEVLESGRQVVQVPDGAGFREVGSLDDHVDNRGDIMGLSLDGSSLVVRMRVGERLGLYPFSLTDGSIGDALYYNDAFDVGLVLQDERTKRVIGIGYQQNMLSRYVYFDPELEAARQTLEAAFPDNAVALLSWSGDMSKILFEVQSPTRPAVLGIFDRAGARVETISESRPDLVSAPMGAARIVSYMAADGTPLHGILTLPAGSAGQALPLVVLEDSAVAPTFDTFAQFLASRGYATFRPGIRQLRRFADVSGMDELNDWVLTMQEDYSAGVNQLIADGIADPARVCIYGEGEEAYTALMSTILSGEFFECAIAVDPLTDLKRLLNWARFASELSLLSYSSPLVRNYDHYSQDDLERLSPVTRAADVNASVLLAGYDTDDHGPSMAAALRRAQKPVEVVSFQGDPKEPADARQENAILTYTAIERFLAEQIGP